MGGCGILQGNGAGEVVAMAKAAQPAARSEGVRPEEGRPAVPRSEQTRPRAEVVGSENARAQAGALGHKRQRPRPRAAGSRDARARAQRTEEPRHERSEPEATDPRRHFVTAERASSRPRGRCGRARCGSGMSLSLPTRSPTPTRRAHLYSSWQQRTQHRRTHAAVLHVRRRDSGDNPPGPF